MPAQLVAVVGNRGCGKTTLTRQLSSLIPGYKTSVALPTAPPPASKAAIEDTFAAMAAALTHCARTDQGAVVDSTLDCELLLVQHELRKGRISTDEAMVLSAYIAALQARVQLPHVVVFLDASPSSCAGRCGLPEAELLELDRDFRSLASRLTIKGSAVYRRNWDALGSVNQVRDTILCAEPQRGWSKTLAPIDVAQVMQECWEEAETSSQEQQKGVDALPLNGTVSSPCPKSRVRQDSPSSITAAFSC